MVFKNKQIALTVIIFIVIIISMAIIYYSMSLSKKKEHFALVETEPLWAFNEFMTRQNCQRNMEFIHRAKASFNVSQRAMADSSSPGRCMSSITDVQQTDEMSYVEESFIKYGMKSICVPMSFATISVWNGGNGTQFVRIRFSNETRDDIQNMMYLYMLNPLYIEFETTGVSEPFIPMFIYRNEHTNFVKEYKGETDLPAFNIMFQRLVNTKLTKKDPFNFPNAKQISELFTTAQMNSRAPKTRHSLKLKIYYLDVNEAQTSGVNMNLAKVYARNPIINSVKIFKSDYKTVENNNTDIFYFHQKVYMQLQNGETPSFTVGFSINVTDKLSDQLAEATEVLKIFMDHSIGKRENSCNFRTNDGYLDSYTPLSNTFSNILSCIMYSEPDNQEIFHFYATTGSNGWNNQGCNFTDRNTLRVELPILSETSAIHIVLTVTPYEKIALFKWKDAENKDKFIFKRTTGCSKNFFTDIFNQRKTGPVTQSDINMTYNSKYIMGLKNVQLGHVNYFNEYNKIN